MLRGHIPIRHYIFQRKAKLGETTECMQDRGRIACASASANKDMHLSLPVW